MAAWTAGSGENRVPGTQGVALLSRPSVASSSRVTSYRIGSVRKLLVTGGLLAMTGVLGVALPLHHSHALQAKHVAHQAQVWQNRQ
jgi:hypothetical protein